MHRRAAGGIDGFHILIEFKCIFRSRRAAACRCRKQQSGAIVRLGDLGTVSLGADDYESRVSFDGIELQDREFFSAIEQKREPNSSFAQILPAMQTLDKLDRSLKSSS